GAARQRRRLRRRARLRAVARPARPEPRPRAEADGDVDGRGRRPARGDRHNRRAAKAARRLRRLMLADIAFEERSGIQIARVRGEVDMSNAGELGATLQGMIDQLAVGLVLDFTDSTYLDSAGLHFIFDLAKRLRDRGQRLELVVPKASPVRSVLSIVNIESLAEMCDSLDEGVARLAKRAADAPPQSP